ncbi:MAG TPA: hypothetical protein DER01_12475 [Phycisphaerales bacterium]|nr:hypothetical protein [Phycisphaerales bacterium]|tara:strand:- start:93 stop:515 length:423 start_codon:yes stop_codon:yes gene_type:complete
MDNAGFSKGDAMFPRKHFFKPFPFASDDLTFKALSIATPVLLSFLCLFAGIGLLMSERFATMYDREAPALFMMFSNLGVTTIALIWLLYMLLLGLSMGWSANDNLYTVLVILFTLSAAYMFMVIMSIFMLWFGGCYMRLT